MRGAVVWSVAHVSPDVVCGVYARSSGSAAPLHRGRGARPTPARNRSQAAARYEALARQVIAPSAPQESGPAPAPQGPARRGSYRGLMAKSISTSLTKLVVTFMPPAE